MNKCPCTIMIIDDSTDDLFLIEKAFRAIGVKDTIHAIVGGHAAIAYMRGIGKFADRRVYAFPNFVTTDLNMPGMGGLAVLDQFQKNPAWAVIPRAVLSSSSDPNDIDKAYLMGACSYVVKSNDSKDLRHSLTALHDFWMTCEDRDVGGIGRQLHLENEVSKRYAQVVGHSKRAPQSGGATHSFAAQIM